MRLSDRLTADRRTVAKHYLKLLADELEALARAVELADSGETAAKLIRRRAIKLMQR